MKRYNTILFDLDGTLTDPGEGITNSVAYALSKYGIAVEDKRSLYRFIGPPLAESFRVYYGFSPEQAREAVDFYREYYRDKGIFENKLYEGIPALLADLRAAGKTLLLATSKPAVFARQILEHFGILRYFTFAAGSNLDGTRVKKAEVIRYALDNAGTAKEEALMVGDREHDVQGAKALGIPCLGVLFGYGDRAELEAAGAALLAETVADVGALLLP